jgi:hypothetical protein
MHKITLVCSSHRESGSCNVGELLNILRAAEPEVVFEEIRPSDFDSYCKNGIGSSLEARAITEYLAFKSFRRVPVDRFDIPETLLAESKREFDRVFDYVEHKSHEYQLLNEENAKSVYHYGFPYLHSIAFETVMTKVAEIEDEIINEAGNQGLTRALERWRHLLQSRDREMVRVIYEYCRENVFGAGVFLVGAAHKMGIVKAITSAKADLVDWKFCL